MINSVPKNYFNKTIFRVGMAILVILLIFILNDNGWDFKQTPSVSCSPKSFEPCLNELYYCTHLNEDCKLITLNRTDLPYILDCDVPYINCNEYKDVPCVDGVCDKKYLQPGESIGKTFNTHHFQLWILIIITICFIVNHLDYLYWRKNENKD
jgi:hypothetical protein